MVRQRPGVQVPLTAYEALSLHNFQHLLLGYRQAVRHGTLTPAFVGSNPTSPVQKLLMDSVKSKNVKTKIQDFMNAFAFINEVLLEEA